MILAIEYDDIFMIGECKRYYDYYIDMNCLLLKLYCCILIII